MDKKKYHSLRDILGDKKLVRDVKTSIILVFALVIGIVTNGVFDGFTIQTLFRVTVAISTVGLMVSVFMVTNDFANRGEEEEEEANEEIRTTKRAIYDLGKEINKVKRYAKTVVKQFNKTEINNLREDEYDKIKNRFDNLKDNVEIKIENYKLVGVKKWRIFKRLFIAWRIRRLTKKLNKIDTKLKKTRIENIYVYYEPVELDDFKIESLDNKKNTMTLKQKLKATPSGFVKKRMAKTNMIKVVMFVGFQGMIYVGVNSWGDFFWRIMIVAGTLTSTAFMSYWLTRKWSNEVYVGLLQERLADLEWIHEEALKLKEADKPVDYIEPQDSFTFPIVAQ